MKEFITLSQGSGGKQTNDLIKNVFVKKFGMTEPLTDSAVLEQPVGSLAFTTDSYVVDPVFFPGGDIGKLAVCGTVNDLAVSGAIPRYISASFIIEEGFPVRDLEIIATSMSEEALKAGVNIVTGDTKVVGKGKCDKIFITTSGIGFIKSGLENIAAGRNIRNGDKLIINGTIGDHAITILGARNELKFSTSIVSDCASLNYLINKMLHECRGIRFMRDLTRGGLAAVLNELAEMIMKGITVNEQAVPVDEQVRGLCEALGFDPLYLANEGKFLVVADPDDEKRILDILRSDPLGRNAALIGEIVPDNKYSVILNTSVGGRRILDMPSGIQLPRIC